MNIWTFNRTIVELKLTKDAQVVVNMVSFNRTIVELKFEEKIARMLDSKAFNRTIVELKYPNDQPSPCKLPPLIVP